MNITQSEITMLPLASLVANKGQLEGVPANPRVLKDDKYKALVKSLKSDNLTGVIPLKVIRHDDLFVVLGGNQRLAALKEAKVENVACIEVPTDTPAETLRKIVVLDNSTYGEWDWDMLANEWNTDELKDWGVDVPKDFTVDPDEETAADTHAHTQDASCLSVASVTLFGQTKETILCETITPEQAEQLLEKVKAEGAEGIIQKLLA